MELRLLAKERHDGRGAGMHQAAGSCSSTAMVNNCRDVFKEPLVGAVAKPENVWGRKLIGTEFTPASGDDGATACLPHRLD